MYLKIAIIGKLVCVATVARVIKTTSRGVGGVNSG